MHILKYLEAYTGLDAAGVQAAIRVQQDPAGAYSFVRWDIPNVAKPTAAQIAAGLAAPDPAPSVAELLDHCRATRAATLAAAWSFDLGSGLVCTTRLDADGRADMNDLSMWGITNASVSGATEPHANVDGSSVMLTPPQCLVLYTKARAVVSQVKMVFAAQVKAVRAKTTTTAAQIDAAAWPKPTVPSA